MRLLADNLCVQGVDHGFFSRHGGVSEGLYRGLNCGAGSRDDPVAVRRNRSRVAEELGLKADALLSVHQIHSADVVVVDDPAGLETSPDMPRADAMVTRRADVGLGILVADCAPVLLADAAAGIVGAAHAGWKGALGGVVEATVSAMESMGADARRIIAAVGPCIHQHSYEVDHRFRDRVLAGDPGGERFFADGRRPGHCQFDLPGYVASRLRFAGVNHTMCVDADTYGDEARFFSYRRATHRSEPDYGRNIAVIRLTPPG